MLLVLKRHLPRGPLNLKQMLFNLPFIRGVSGLIYCALLTPSLWNSIPSRLNRGRIQAGLSGISVEGYNNTSNCSVSGNPKETLNPIQFSVECTWARQEVAIFLPRFLKPFLRDVASADHYYPDYGLLSTSTFRIFWECLTTYNWSQKLQSLLDFLTI